MNAKKIKSKIEALERAVVAHENGWVNGSTRATGAELFECAKEIPFDELKKIFEELGRRC